MSASCLIIPLPSGYLFVRSTNPASSLAIQRAKTAREYHFVTIKFAQAVACVMRANTANDARQSGEENKGMDARIFRSFAK
jgi:hypothetical protein